MLILAHKQIATLISEANGHLVGNTRLQKAAYLLQAAGVGFGFKFSYYLHGPYSEEVKIASDDAVALSLVSREQKLTSWGGKYFVYTSQPSMNADPRRSALLAHLSSASSIAVELAVTALYLAKETGSQTPWDDVAELKSDIATQENLAKAKELYKKLLSVSGLPSPLPQLQ